ncbi:hypothetical protein E2C01_063508 [Portunus trituberculatus]|uniref:Endonuclease/exonuclease/phosphatase domain-containing protein n=1 Tax=Portunus trituberculatus TaxID=210409 RepID=A0A5B7HHT7_PORTR|nr:hypothetical protein [Portunus trituberculatus]
MDSPHLSLLSTPGLTTRYNSQTSAPSVLDLFLGSPLFSTATYTTSLYMGSDHLPLLASSFQVTPTPNPGCLPRWYIKLDGWPVYQTALASPLDISTLSLEEAAETLAWTLEAAVKTSFCLTIHRSPI